MLLLLSAAGVAAEDKNLLTLAQDLGATLEWDPLRDAGVLVVGNDRIALEVGSSAALINYRLKVVVDPPTRRNGVVWLTTAAVKAISDGLQQDRTAHAGEHLRVAAIVIDPGHGGKDPGTSGDIKDGSKTVTLREKDITLDVALRLGALLQAAFPDKKVVYTRTTDVFIDLDARPQIANKLLEGTEDMVIYMSIHVNSGPLKVGKAAGFQVWHLPPDYARKVLDEKNVQPEDLDILGLLNQMKEEEISIETLALAKLVSDGLQSTIGDRTSNLGLLKQDWNVVRKARMPAVLVEIGFINNPAEAANLAAPAYLQDVARGLYSGLSAAIERFERSQE